MPRPYVFASPIFWLALSLCCIVQPTVSLGDDNPALSVHLAKSSVKPQKRNLFQTFLKDSWQDNMSYREPDEQDPVCEDENEEDDGGLVQVRLPQTVHWSVTEKNISITKQAAMWGVPSKDILRLNDHCSQDTILQPGERLCVYEAAKSEAKVTRSIGRPSRGRLQNAVIMPEGEGFFLRTYRTRSWGCPHVIESLLTAFATYAKAYPEGPAVNVGDISKRRGGKIKPHASHQTGRDVDIGFIHKTQPRTRHPEHFVTATRSNLDADKTWFVIHALLQTEQVQTVYVDKLVQRLLYQVAKDQLDEEELLRIFSLPKHKESSSAILQHWPGHKNHFHIRFKCPPNQPRCRR